MELRDPLHGPTDPNLHWTTTNVGEAAPGVQTPLSWTLWSEGDDALRRMAYRVGVLSRKEWLTRSESTDRVFRPFFGRSTLQVEFFALMGDRMPGTSGADVTIGLLGRMPPGLRERPTRRRYPAIFLRLPVVFLTVPGQLARAASEFDAWYGRSLSRVTNASLVEATTVFAEARARLATGLTL